ncbi:RNA-directed DNA polymerase, eukaryota, partial [Tanacetum coccineum]
VWNCGEDKSLGPDGYTFEFFRKYWSFVGPDFCVAVEHFFDKGSFPKGCNLSFIALILKVTDAKFVTDFRPISLIGCVYKVVTKVLANRLALVISGLVSDTQSAFIDNREILDGPFILNWCKRKKKQAMFFKVDFAKAYDSVRWDYLLVAQAAARIGCDVMHSQFCYLGVMVGDCMSRETAWVDMVHKLRSHLSNWKVKTLSTSGRLTLLKSVLGASPLYNMSIYKVPRGVLKVMEAIRSRFFNGADQSDRKITWVAWDKVLASKKNGGLGVSSFHALNRALLLKWVWRFISQDGSLWFRVIQALHGPSLDSHSVNLTSNWCTILREVNLLKDKGFPRLFALELDKVVSVAAKLGSFSVDDSFRRSVRDGAERQQWDDLCALLESVSLSPAKDRWICDLTGDGEFRVKEVRNSLDDLLLPSQPDATRWVKCIPIKINVFVWRARLDCLPSRSNLVRRGVALDSVTCPLCHAFVEDIQHVLFRCDIAQLDVIEFFRGIIG